jgi:hypothetical protein
VRRKFAPWNNPAAKPFIEFRGVTKRFDEFAAETARFWSA